MAELETATNAPISYIELELIGKATHRASGLLPSACGQLVHLQGGCQLYQT